MKTGLTALAATCVAQLLMPAAAPAQVPGAACAVYLQSARFTGAASEVARLIDLQDSVSSTSFVLRRNGRGVTGNACTAPASVRDLAQRLGTRPPTKRLRLMPAEVLVVGNSAYPRDWNDGALWGGRGLNAAVTAGAEFRWGPFSAAVAPVVTWQTNSAFDRRVNGDTARSDHAHPWWGLTIDAPQRFGEVSFTRIDAGQSFARIDVRGFAAGISHENIRWGPARRNPLMLSGTAPGFAHAFVETGRPVDVWLGDIEFQLFWGRLRESEYFDNDPDNDARMLAGLLVALQPGILDGLTIGGGRLQSLTWWPELSLSDVVIGPYRGISENPSGRGGDNQLISLFFRWAVAPAGIEAYGEWAREDHWGRWVELLRNLDASQAWTIGLQKLVRMNDNALQLSAEVTHLSDALPINFATRSVLAFYTNASVTQGHTHRGQLLGAPIGTGAESLFIGGDYFWSKGRTSLSIERTRYEDDAYNVRFAPQYGADARDTEVSFRAGHMATFGALSVDAELGSSLRFNRGFLGLETLPPGAPYRRDHNIALRLGARWTPQPEQR